MKNMFMKQSVMKQSVLMILSTLFVIAVYFSALGFETDNLGAASLTTFLTLVALVLACGITNLFSVAFITLVIAVSLFAAIPETTIFGTGFGAFSIFVVASVAATFAKHKNFSFGKIFLLMVAFLALTGVGLYFTFTGQFLSGLVLIGTGILFLIILNMLDIVVQFSGEKSIFAKLSEKPKGVETETLAW